MFEPDLTLWHNKHKLLYDNLINLKDFLYYFLVNIVMLLLQQYLNR